MFKTSPLDSEYVTRKQHIDKKLNDAGWKVVEFDALKPLDYLRNVAAYALPISCERNAAR